MSNKPLSRRINPRIRTTPIKDPKKQKRKLRLKNSIKLTCGLNKDANDFQEKKIRMDPNKQQNRCKIKQMSIANLKRNSDKNCH